MAGFFGGKAHHDAARHDGQPSLHIITPWGNVLACSAHQCSASTVPASAGPPAAPECQEAVSSCRLSSTHRHAMSVFRKARHLQPQAKRWVCALQACSPKQRLQPTPSEHVQKQHNRAHHSVLHKPLASEVKVSAASCNSSMLSFGKKDWCVESSLARCPAKHTVRPCAWRHQCWPWGV